MRYPVWECRKHGEIYQISAIIRDGDDAYRACHSISQSMLDNAWYPELLMRAAIIEAGNRLYSMYEGTR